MANSGKKRNQVLRYEMTASEDWDRKAAAMAADGRLLRSDSKSERVSSVRIDGPCPRCGDEFSQTRALTLPSSSIRGSTQTTLTAPIAWADFLCDCKVAHPGAPGNQRGCGLSFSLLAQSEER